MTKKEKVGLWTDGEEQELFSASFAPLREFLLPLRVSA